MPEVGRFRESPEELGQTPKGLCHESLLNEAINPAHGKDLRRLPGPSPGDSQSPDFASFLPCLFLRIWPEIATSRCTARHLRWNMISRRGTECCRPLRPACGGGVRIPLQQCRCVASGHCGAIGIDQR